MSQVVSWACRDQPRFDYTAARELQLMMGRDRFAQMIEHSVFKMIDRVCLLEKALHAGDLATAREIATKLDVMGRQTGLEDFARVAEDVANCCDVGDPVAIGAVVARLVRTGEISFFSVLEMTETI